MQGEAANFVSITGDGVHTKGKTVTHDAAGEGAHQIHMSAEGIGIHSDAMVQAWQADDNFITINGEGVVSSGRNSIKKQAAGSTLEMNGEGISQKGPLIRLN